MDERAVQIASGWLGPLRRAYVDDERGGGQPHRSGADGGGTADRSEELRTLAAEAAVWATRARADGTRRVYRSAWVHFTAWCRRLGLEPLSGDAGQIGLYLAGAAERLAVPTLRVHLAAIATAHRLAGLAIDLRHPRIAQVLEGIARTRAGTVRRQAPPLTMTSLAALVSAQAPGSLGIRNRAMLLIGFGAALRRSELVALNAGDVVEVPERGLEITVRRSKTDRLGRGEGVAIWAARDPSLCAVTAWQAWMALRGSIGADEPLFCAVRKNGVLTGRRLSDKVVVRLIKEAARAAGLANPERYSGHSLRAGLATAAAEEEAGLHDIMRQTRHKSADTARRYLRTRDRWRNNVTERLFRRGRAAESGDAPER